MSVWNDCLIWNTPNFAAPFEVENVNPASFDLRLGNQIRLPHPVWNTLTSEDMHRMILDESIRKIPYWSEPLEFESFWLMPHGKGISFVLCASLEFVNIPDDSIALLFSKSSTGRVGLEHLHAGYGDCGFSGTWTWELHNVAPWPIELVAGKRLMQQVMIRMTDKPARTYKETGRYNGQVMPTPAIVDKV